MEALAFVHIQIELYYMEWVGLGWNCIDIPGETATDTRDVGVLHYFLLYSTFSKYDMTDGLGHGNILHTTLA